MDDNFIVDVNRILAKAGDNLRLATIAFINDLNTEVIITTPGPGNSIAKHPSPRSPTGFLRGSWYANLNSAQAGKGEKDPSGGISVSRANLVAGSIQPGDTYYLVNSAEYAPRVEYGFVGEDARGRHYNQAGRFWIRMAVQKAPQIAEHAIANVASGNWSRPTGGISGGQFTA